MMRYLKLYLNFLRFSFSKAMEFRLDFTFRIIMDCIYYGVNIAFFQVLFLHTPLIAGWSNEEMMVFISITLLVDSIHMTVFSSNMWWLPFYINRGELDFYLIRPVSPLFFLSLREFSANSFMNLLIALGIFIFSLINYSKEFSFAELSLLILLILNGCFLYYCLQMLMVIPVFWTQSTRGFIDLFYSMGLIGERPDRIYKGVIRVLFTWILPFCLISSFPAKIFIEGFKWETFLHITGVTFTFWVIMKLFWAKGLKNYSSASS